MAGAAPIQADAQPGQALDGLRKFVDIALLPLLTGAKLENGVFRADAGQALTRVSGQEVFMRSTTESADYLKLQFPYAPSTLETQVMADFAVCAADLRGLAEQPYFRHLAHGVARRTVAKALQYPNEALLLGVLDAFERLASQTYEGHRIAAGVGFENKDIEASDIELVGIWDLDFSKVLTAGLETLIIVDPNGRLAQFRELYENAQLAHAPHFARMIAEWTTASRPAITLNRNGEVLVFKNKRLEFAYRRGAWRCLAHDSVRAQLGDVRNEMVRQRVMETCIDVSFARSGGCIGIARNKTQAKKMMTIVKEPDRIANGDAAKTQVIRHLIREHGTDFLQVPRRFRQALAAIDGAVVLDNDGKILSVGAIVKVDGGSEAGARQAAAKALAKYGVGIKVSADGEIAGYKGGANGTVERLFSLA